MCVRNRKILKEKIKTSKIIIWGCVVISLCAVVVLVSICCWNTMKNIKQKVSNCNEQNSVTRKNSDQGKSVFRYLDIRINNQPYAEYLSHAFPKFNDIDLRYSQISVSPNNFGVLMLHESYKNLDASLNGVLSGILPETNSEYIEFYLLVCIRTGDYITSSLKYINKMPILLSSILYTDNTQKTLYDKTFSFVFNIIFSDEFVGRYFRALNTYKEYIEGILHKEDISLNSNFVDFAKNHLLLVTKFMNYLAEDLFGFVSKYKDWDEIDNLTKYRMIYKMSNNWPVFLTFNMYNYLVVYITKRSRSYETFKHQKHSNEDQNDKINENGISELFSHIEILLQPYFDRIESVTMEETLSIFYNIFEHTRKLRHSFIMFLEQDYL